MSEQRHGGSDHKEGGSGQVGSTMAAAAPVGALCFYVNAEHSPLEHAMTVHRHIHISACFVAWTPASSWKTHNSNQAYDNELVTLRAQRWDRGANLLLLQTHVV